MSQCCWGLLPQIDTSTNFVVVTGEDLVCRMAVVYFRTLALALWGCLRTARQSFSGGLTYIIDWLGKICFSPLPPHPCTLRNISLSETSKSHWPVKIACGGCRVSNEISGCVQSALATRSGPRIMKTIIRLRPWILVLWPPMYDSGANFQGFFFYFMKCGHKFE